MNEVGPLSDDWQEWYRTKAHLDFATQEALDELLSSPVFRVSKKERRDTLFIRNWDS